MDRTIQPVDVSQPLAMATQGLCNGVMSEIAMEQRWWQKWRLHVTQKHGLRLPKADLGTPLGEVCLTATESNTNQSLGGELITLNLFYLRRDSDSP